MQRTYAMSSEPQDCETAGEIGLKGEDGVGSDGGGKHMSQEQQQQHQQLGQNIRFMMVA